MRKVLRSCWPPLLAAGILIFALTDPYWAQDKKGSMGMGMGGGKTGKALDKAAYKALHDVIDHGADLFNINGDYAGCYRAYEAGLIAVKPFLAHRPLVQKMIDDGLADAAKKHRVIDRAFALRRVLAQVRIAVRPGEASPGKDKKTKKDKEEMKGGVTKSLWDRLGGEKNVRKVVKDFIKIAGDDAKVNLTRNGKYKLDEKTVKLLEKTLVEFTSSATGGPLKYKGPDMKSAHKGMGIKNSEFDAAKADLKKALENHGAKEADIKELLKIVESTRKDIVEKKKKIIDMKGSADKKDADKKSTEKPKDGKVGTVSGTVVLNGRPDARAGYLTLVSNANKRTFSTYIHEDGTYLFRTPIPAGDYVVVIEKGPKEEGQPPAAIPEQYRSAATSPLRFTVEAGNQQRDLNIMK
jgi:hemoglobin